MYLFFSVVSLECNVLYILNKYNCSLKVNILCKDLFKLLLCTPNSNVMLTKNLPFPVVSLQRVSTFLCVGKTIYMVEV